MKIMRSFISKSLGYFVYSKKLVDTVVEVYLKGCFIPEGGTSIWCSFSVMVFPKQGASAT